MESNRAVVCLDPVRSNTAVINTWCAGGASPSSRAWRSSGCRRLRRASGMGPDRKG